MSTKQPYSPQKPSAANNSQRNAIIIVVVLIAIVAIFLFLNRGGGDPAVTPTATPQPQSQEAGPDGIALGDFIVGSSINSDGCVTNQTTSFTGNSVIYMGVQPSDFPQGTVFFVRHYVGDALYEESDEVTADEDYEDTCVEFSIEGSGTDLQAGNYESQFYVNGNLADTVEYTVR